MNEKTKVQKSCLNCFYFQWNNDDDEDAHCVVHGCSMSAPESTDDPDYGYCSEYEYKYEIV